MGIEFLTNYNVPIVIGVCLCVGYVIKNLVQSSYQQIYPVDS